jgi:hypothetical protein
VENIIGAGVFNNEEKSWGGSGVGGLSETGDIGSRSGSDSVEETERRLVRAGVRVGYGGTREPELE